VLASAEMRRPLNESPLLTGTKQRAGVVAGRITLNALMEHFTHDRVRAVSTHRGPEPQRHADVRRAGDRSQVLPPAHGGQLPELRVLPSPHPHPTEHAAKFSYNYCAPNSEQPWLSAHDVQNDWCTHTNSSTGCF